MNTENSPKAPTIYGTVSFEQFNDAIETVCKYVEGLANTYTIKDMLTEEYRDKLEPDLIIGGISMMRVNMTHTKLIKALKGVKAELLEKKAAKERAAPAEMNVPSDPAPAEPGYTCGPKTENL